MNSPAAERNKQPILEVLERTLPDAGLVLEIASGTGQHVVHFARALPSLVWQPSEPDPMLRECIGHRIASAKLDNVHEPLDLDVTRTPWPVARADALVCINLLHIAPWEATLGLLTGARSLLEAGAPLYLYGPYRRFGRHTAPSNAAFDEHLQRRDPRWGVRDLERVQELAEICSFALTEVVEMPANNFSVLFRRK